MYGKKTSPQTIQIFLPTGDPTGIKLAKITTSIIEAIEVPRALLSEFLKLENIQQVALYCLVGIDDKTGLPVAYIGQTSSLFMRLKQHHKDKTFWNKAFIFVSITNSFTASHVLYLESLAISIATMVNRYQLINGNAGLQPHTPVHLKAECDVLFEVIEVLASTLGLPVFKALTAHNIDCKEVEKIYYCIRRSSDAKGHYNSEGFVVLKGSLISPDITRNFEQNNYLKLREQLIRDGVIKARIFDKDYLFNSPSAASAVCLGSSSNGWNDWKDSSGKTLNENERNGE
ncbi:MULTISPECIES: GIY-YIG nuclease family protein [Cysteiniphilum]|uniref:DUF4357 domain-containing protein n=1 Tax=Cysteiniphilum litorale TaxID=2056700 RepID=A0A8J2Z1W7_9GAMM|nr:MULTISPECIES: GIY-YIG nuclease family protein [Cysteiniphilum]GGF86928.1 hypothetical protein GCM10010995_00300 [Cysteiniphilum litorale]